MSERDPKNPFQLAQPTPAIGKDVPSADGPFSGKGGLPGSAALAPSALGISVDAAKERRVLSPRDIFLNQKDQRADLIWGPSKTGKGVQAWFAIYWVMMTYGKKFLYLTAEPGSINASIMTAARAGWGDIFSLVDQPNLISTMSSILEGGMWPVVVKNNDGTFSRTFNSKEARPSPDEYGLIIVDSLTSVGEEIVKWYTQPNSKAILPQTPRDDKFKIRDQAPGGLLVEYGGSAPTHIGEACKYLYRMVVASAALPYQRVLWIAREQRVNRGEKKDKDQNIIVAGEPMYGPDLPGTAATARVTSWFGGSYHTAMVPNGVAIKDDRKDVGGGAAFLLPGATEKLSTIPGWEYRLYIKSHPDPITGIMYDAGNRLEAYLNANPQIVKPYIVCTEVREGKQLIHHGINDIWELERQNGIGMVEDLRETLAEVLAKFQKK